MIQKPVKTSILAGQSNEKIYLGFLDGLRAIAALYVVIHHALLTTIKWPDYFNSIPSLNLRQLANCFMFGHYSVDVFIVLSGFCLMLPVIRCKKTPYIETWTFFKKRIRRIVPTYYLALVLTLTLIWLFIGQKTGNLWDMTLPIDLRYLPIHLLLLQDILYETSAKINYSFWSISVECRIYLFFPILIFLWRRIGAVTTTFLSVIFSYLLLYFIQRTPLNTSPWGVSPHYLGLFAMGMLGAGICFSDNTRLLKFYRKVPTREISLGSVVIVTLFSLFWLKYPQYTKYFSLISLFTGILVVSLLITLTQNKHFWLTKILSWKPIVFIGTFAYSIYLLHAPLLQLLWQYGIHPMNLEPMTDFLILVIIGIPIILVISYLFFLICERPFIKKYRE
jgi:peptidoglycan/LPS O-acetylase OafA/YrhL